MYIQQSIPQITIHLLYIDTLQKVNCDIMYIQQTAPQITIHLLYIVTLQQVNCDIMYIHNRVYYKSQSTCCIYTIQQMNCDIMYIQQSIPQIPIHLLYTQGLGASEKTNYIILQGGELTCFHFFKLSC